MPDESRNICQELADAKKAYLIAPAGYGKTYTISEAVAHYTADQQLILTHTNAGIAVLKSQLRKKGASSKQYHLETIDGLARKYVLSYPNLSEWEEPDQEYENDWKQIHEAFVKLLKNCHIQRVIISSYAGVLVDEYQDCTLSQHNIVLALSGLLPTRILGDPLQGIFNFDKVGNPLVDWKEDIAPLFAALPELQIPWRWRLKGTNERLGEWLAEVRKCLIDGNQVDLTSSPLTYIQIDPKNYNDHIEKCSKEARKLRDGTVLVIHHRHHNDSAGGNQNSDVALAKRIMSGFVAIDSLYSGLLLNTCLKLDEGNNLDVALACLEFLAKCIAKPPFGNVITKLRSGGRIDRLTTPAHLLPEIRQILDHRDYEAILDLCEKTKKTKGVRIVRLDLWLDFIRSIENYLAASDRTLVECAWAVRSRTSVMGRRVARRVVSRTHLVKGLEFDHVIIFDASQLKKNDLYVALTRASKSLTVLSPISALQPN